MCSMACEYIETDERGESAPNDLYVPALSHGGKDA